MAKTAGCGSPRRPGSRRGTACARLAARRREMMEARERRYPRFVSDLLRDEVILVTGGGTGLGKAMATRFTASGCFARYTSVRVIRPGSNA